MLIPNEFSSTKSLQNTSVYPLPRISSSVLLARLLLPIALALSTAASAATKVAFIADQGTGSGAKAVLSMIKDEGADIVLIQGDLGYELNAAVEWEQNLNEFLGEDFPVLAVAGNHENYEWPLYERFIQRRVERANGLDCSGKEGVKASCTFENLQVVQVAQGISEVPSIDPDDNYDSFIRSSFNDSDYAWRVCSWHKNQNAMQAYSKSNATGWDIYDACLDSGAMIAMGHAHTYSRTYLMTDFRTQSVAHRNNDMLLEPGRSFAVVSGLGGWDIKPQENSGDWFASVYTRSQGAKHGALFCTLRDITADCYFKAIDGTVPDTFTLRTGFDARSTPQEPTIEEDKKPVDENPEFLLADDSPADSPADSSIEGVFRRTDKDEYRWIGRDDSGQLSSRWISESCATQLGDEAFSGDWGDLMALTTTISTDAGPCSGKNNKVSTPVALAPTTGFVFSRTDKVEYRWIADDEYGSVGNIWIDKSCADRLGGATASGDWHDLNDVAPGFDTLVNPCY